jgi:hypothetical protein
MARIIDALRPAETRRTPVSQEPAAALKADSLAPAANPVAPIDDDDSDVPFIEVGAPKIKLGNLKTTRGPAPIPTILPLNRASAERQDLAPPGEIEDYPLFRIAFQPLPFEREPADPANLRFARELIAYHHPDHPVSEQYQRLLAELETQLGTDPGKSLLFSAAHPAAGVTSVLLNLALSCARREGSRVAVVDANLARPAIATRLGIAPAPGLIEVLSRTVPLGLAIQATGQANLEALTSGSVSGPPDMGLWPLVLDQLKQRFDWILVDAAEWGHPELPVLSGTCAATYLILGQPDMGSPELNDLLLDIPRHGGHLRGYILRTT